MNLGAYKAAGHLYLRVSGMPKCVICEKGIRRKPKKVELYEDIGPVETQWWTGIRIPDGNWVCHKCLAKLASD